MFKKFTNSSAEIKKTVKLGFPRFPEAIMFAVLTTIALILKNNLYTDEIYIISDGYEAAMTNQFWLWLDSFEQILPNLVMVLGLGVPAFLIKSLFFERYRETAWGKHVISRPLSTIFIWAGLTTYFYNFEGVTEFVTDSRYVAISASLFLIFLILPYLLRRAHFEKYVLYVFIRFVVTYFVAGIVIYGFAAIILSIDALFSMNIGEILIENIAIVALGIVAPIIFLSFIPKYDEDMEDVVYAPFLQSLLTNIVIPLLTFYSLVLIVYFISILITGSWPKGIIADLVLWFSLLSTFILFITYPIRERNLWTSLFHRFFPMILIPLLLMKLVAVGIRINAYGITENRYIVLALGVWLFAIMLYLSIGRNIRNIWLPISLVICLLVAVFSPVNMFAVSKYSQNLRLEKIFSKYNMLKDGKLVIVPKAEVAKVSEFDRDQINEIFDYFYDYTENDYEPIRSIPSEPQTDEYWDFLDDLQSGVGDVDQSDETDSTLKDISYELPLAELIDIKGYDSFIDFRYVRTDDSFTFGKIQIEFSNDNEILLIKKNNAKIGKVFIYQLAKQVANENKGKKVIGSREMSKVFETEDVKLNFIFTDLNGIEDTSTGEISVPFVNYYLLIDLK
jgi:hypothetical protein